MSAPYLHADQPDGNGPLNVTPEREALIERLAAESRAKQQDRFVMPALVEGENAYRVAEFEVSLELLKSVLQMPAESLIIGVRPGDTPYRATLVVKVADPSLPLCPVHRPPMLNPTVTKEQAKWNWNVAVNLRPSLIACVVCGDDAELVGAPGPNEPVDEYTCIGCGRSFLADGTITFEPVENPDA